MPGPRGAPLLYAGTRDGINSAVLAFEPRRSDLPLQVAFPILLANLTGELLGSSTAPTEAVDPGTPVELHIPAGAVGLTVIGPDGATTEMAPSSTAAGQLRCHVRRHRPARHLHGDADPRSRCLARDEHRCAVERGAPRRRIGDAATDGRSCCEPVGVAGRPGSDGAGPLRRRPVRRRRIDDRTRQRRDHRRRSGPPAALRRPSPGRALLRARR